MQRLLNNLYILDETAYLTLDGENIVIQCSGKEKKRVPFANLEAVYCFSYLGASPALMGKCANDGISLCFFNPNGSFLAKIQGKTKGNIFLRKAQFEKFANPDPLLMQNAVASKLSNTRFVIRRSKRDHAELDEDGELSRCIEYLEQGISNVYETTDREVILGIEGNCAKAYFRVFDRLILHQKEDFRLTARIKRPPTDPVNAVLSFLYTIMTSAYASALEAVGLDSCYGFYHALRSGRSSLACDLVEESRCIAERLVLTMINLKQLSLKDFEMQESGAVLLNKDGKKKVLAAYQERRKSTIVHPYLGEKIPMGLLPCVQSHLLAQYVRGDLEEYPCFLMKE